jgi:hypothetical protein
MSHTDRPPPPRIPPPGTLTEEEEELLPPCNLADITHDALERVIGVRPVDLTYYERAFTHPSSGIAPDYEVLEFLGASHRSFVKSCSRIQLSVDGDRSV